jgi:hypothetical protein
MMVARRANPPNGFLCQPQGETSPRRDAVDMTVAVFSPFVSPVELVRARKREVAIPDKVPSQRTLRQSFMVSPQGLGRAVQLAERT